MFDDDDEDDIFGTKAPAKQPAGGGMKAAGSKQPKGMFDGSDDDEFDIGKKPGAKKGLGGFLDDNDDDDDTFVP